MSDTHQTIEEALEVSRFRAPHHKATVNVMYTSGWLNAFYIKLLRPYGLSPQQFNILRILRGRHPEPASVNLLISRMLEKTSNASRLVEKLRQKGLVTREACPEDRRQVNVWITEKGTALLQDLDTEMDKREAAFSHVLSPDEANQLSALLDKLRAAALEAPAPSKQRKTRVGLVETA